jgi:hypothetical protein
MTRARARSLWLAGPALLAACSSSPSTHAAATTTTTPVETAIAATTPAATTTTSAPPSSSAAPASTIVAVDPTVLIPIAIGNKPFPANADEIATEHRGYTGDPNAILQAWLITPMAVPSGPDVRLLGFERTIGINSTTAVFLTGPIDPEATLTSIEAALAPSPPYAVTTSTRIDGTVTIHGFDAQPTNVQGSPPGWTVEASVVDQLGTVRIKRSDYAFAKVVPTFSDLPPVMQTNVVNQDAIAVSIGGVLASIAYEYGTNALGDPPTHRTQLGYDITGDLATATAALKTHLTVGWTVDEQADAVYFTSTTTAEVWTLDDADGSTHLTYDTGS